MTSFSLGQRFSKVLVEDLKRTQLVQYAVQHQLVG